MKVIVYFDVFPWTKATDIFPTIKPCDKLPGATRYKIVVEIPDPAKPDHEIKAIPEEV